MRSRLKTASVCAMIFVVGLGHPMSSAEGEQAHATIPMATAGELDTSDLYTSDMGELKRIEDVPMASKERWNRYVNALKASTYYQTAWGNRSDVILPVVEELNQELGGGFVAKQKSFLEVLKESEYGIGSGESDVTRFVQSSDHLEQQPFWFMLRCKDASGAYKGVCRVSAEQFRDLKFRLVSHVQYLHPLDRVIDRHTVSNRPLSEVVTELCHNAGVNFSIDATHANDVRISQNIEGATVYGCLQQAVSAANWELKLSTGNDDQANSPPPPQASGFSLRYDSSGFSFDAVTDLMLMRVYLNEVEQVSLPIETPIDAFKHLAREVARVNRETKYMVTVRPIQKS